jgi:hypothetical protein
MNDFLFYILIILVIAVGFLTVRKVATCLIKTIVALAVLAIMAFLYWSHTAA